MVDFLTVKVYAYTSSGQRDAAADFDLDSDNADPFGISYVNDRFYVVNNSDEAAQVYAYTSSGQRDEDADFNLPNGDPFGATYVNDLFYVVDNGDDQVYAYTSSGQ